MIIDNENYSLKGRQVIDLADRIKANEVAFKPFPDSVVTDGTTEQFMNSILALGEPVGTAFLGTVSLSDLPAGLVQEEVMVYVYSDYVVYCEVKSTDVAPYIWWCASYNYQGWRPVNTDTTYSAGTGLELTGTTFSVNSTIATKSEIPSVFQTVFYMNASETGVNRHIYKKADMTDPATSKDVFDANDKGQVILRISTSATPEMYSDAYLQNAYSATGDYQLLFLDEKTYRSFDTSNLNDDTFVYSARVIQDKLTAGTNVQINGATISATDTTYSDFVGATSGDAGTHGLVPAPAAGDESKVLKGDGTWAGLPDGIKTLTTADYDYPTNNPVGVALWKLPTGVYKIAANTAFYPASGGTHTVTADTLCLIFKAPGDSNGAIEIWNDDNGHLSAMSVTNTGSASTSFNPNSSFPWTIITAKFVKDELTSTSAYMPLSAKQGKALKDLIDSLVIKNAGAPTTSTVGTVGMLLEDTTNGKLYQCTAVTPGVDPDPTTYTWEEVGGGSGPTVVQTTGTSQTDVMSQNAVTEMVFADPGTKKQVRIGNTSSVSTSSISIGDETQGSAAYSIAIGKTAEVSSNANYGIAMGYVSKAKVYGVGIGQSAGATGDGSTAIGSNTTASGNYSMVLAPHGNQKAVASATSAIAIGSHTSASGNGSIALGRNASATAQGEMNIGSTNTSYGYNNSNYRLLTGLYDPQSDHDAATKGYADTKATITMTTTDPGEGAATTANTLTAVYS